MQQEYPNIEWDFILETIKAEKCILFLGPGLFENERGESLDTQLGQYLKVNDNPDIQSFYDREGLFLFTSGTKKTTSYYKIKSFYNQAFPEASSIFEKLANIPFHLVISITPDKKCLDAFEAAGVPVDFDFFWKKQPATRKLTTPTSSKPLLYNLFGSIDRQDSMVLTHDDLFEYFESIFQENTLSERIKLSIKSAHNFIFLGLDFEKWYMQLLLRILYLHNEKYEFMRYAASQQVSNELKTFCYQQFRIEFIATNIDAFVDELADRCQAVGMKRVPAEKKESGVKKWIKWMADDRVEDVFESFMEYLEQSGANGRELKDDLVLLNNRWKRLKRKEMLEVIDSRDANVEGNKINQSVLELLNEAKQLE